MIISISTGLYYKKDYREILDIISESGWTNIELFYNQAFMNISNDIIKKEVKKRGMNVESVHAPMRLFYEESVSEEDIVNECLGLAKMLNAGLVVTHDIFERDEQGKLCFRDKEHFDTMSHFKNSDIMVITENLPQMVADESMMYDVEYMHKYVKENGYKITYDVGHAATCGYDIIDAYKALGSFVRNIHLSDCKSGIEHRVIGKGNLPIKEFLLYLKEDGYEYPLTVEYDFDNKKRNDIKSNQEAIDALKMTLEYINEIIL